MVLFVRLLDMKSHLIPLSSAFLCEVAALQRVGDSTRIYIRKISMSSGSIEYKDDDGQQKRNAHNILSLVISF